MSIDLSISTLLYITPLHQPELAKCTLNCQKIISIHFTLNFHIKLWEKATKYVNTSGIKTFAKLLSVLCKGCIMTVSQ